ncbi:MAG: TonB-dependent receptor, partial [Bacteroidota bacterium]|nr:TonB-dependent receptor [Bacteroidota bacterium]
DGQSGEALVDATVTLKNNTKAYATRTGLDGSFVFKNIIPGSYTESVQYIGYNDKQIQVEAKRGITFRNLIQLRLHLDRLSTVVVNANMNRGSDISARRTERLASNLRNIISEKQIENSPDITVGNVLQRAAGVSVVKNSSGDGENAIIRGMADRYNYTTINGVKIPSPDDKTRSIPMDIFPSDLLQRLEVVKSLTPSMEGDAIGGVTNMVLKEAPRTLTYSLNGSLGYSNFFNKNSFTTFDRSGAPWKTPYEIHGSGYAPQPSDFNVKYLEYKTVKLPVNGFINGSIGDRITNKLGFLAAASFQHIYKGSNSLFYPPSGQPQPIPTANTPVFGPLEFRTYNSLQSRLGTHLLLNYDLNTRNKISFYTAYFQLDQVEHRNLQQGLSQYLHMSGQDYVYDRSLFQRQIIWTNSLQGNDVITNRLSTDWSLVYSKAQSKTPIWIDQQYSDIVSFDNSTHNLTSERKNLQDFPFTFTHSNEVDRSGYLNFHYKLAEGLVFSAGGMYRHKTRDNLYEQYTLYAGNQPFTTIQNASFPRLTRVDTTDGLTYTSIENILAYYGQFKWNKNKWELLGGLRVEHTHHSYWSELSIYLPGKTGSYDYTDLLPSVNVKYSFNTKNDLRASYFSGISRPNYFEYIPVNFSGDYFDQRGNPNIKHVQSNNLDLRFEHYYGAEDYFMVGTFYKYIINPIESAFQSQTTSQFVLEPVNFGNATNYGAELVFTKHFRNFGIRGNYSYTKSSITTSKLVYTKDSNGNYVIYNSTQTRPLQGQSDHIANLSLLYRNIKRGVEAEVSWVYTGQRIEIVSPFKNLDYWQKATSQVDFSLNVKASKRVTLFAKVSNLTNNPLVLELHTNANGYYFNNPNYPGQNNKNYIETRHDNFNQSFIIGFRLR